MRRSLVLPRLIKSPLYADMQTPVKFSGIEARALKLCLHKIFCLMKPVLILPDRNRNDGHIAFGIFLHIYDCDLLFRYKLIQGDTLLKKFEDPRAEKCARSCLPKQYDKCG